MRFGCHSIKSAWRHRKKKEQRWIIDPTLNMSNRKAAKSSLFLCNHLPCSGVLLEGGSVMGSRQIVVWIDHKNKLISCTRLDCIASSPSTPFTLSASLCWRTGIDCNSRESSFGRLFCIREENGGEGITLLAFLMLYLAQHCACRMTYWAMLSAPSGSM